MKIIIVGSGVAGLTLALACQKEGMEVRLYEKAKKLRNIGGGIFLWSNGIRSLEELGVADALKLNKKITSFQAHASEKNIIIDDAPVYFMSCIEGQRCSVEDEMYPIERSVLQARLLEQLLPNILVLNKTCVSLEENENFVTVFFSDGTSDSADIVIGADGIHSRVRKHLVGDEEVTRYANYNSWGGITELNQLPELSQEKMLTVLEYGKLLSLWPLGNHRYMWLMLIQTDQSQRLSHEESFQLLKNLTKNWKSKIVQNIMAVCHNERYFHFPINTVPPRPHWSGERIVLIGDAAHAMGPSLGQGTSVALEDVTVLFKLLKSNLTIPEVIHQYEHLRYEAVRHIAALEEESTSILFNPQFMDLFQEKLRTSNPRTTVNKTVSNFLTQDLPSHWILNLTIVDFLSSLPPFFYDFGYELSLGQEEDGHVRSQEVDMAVHVDPMLFAQFLASEKTQALRQHSLWQRVIKLWECLQRDPEDNVEIALEFDASGIVDGVPTPAVFLVFDASEARPVLPETWEILRTKLLEKWLPILRGEATLPPRFRATIEDAIAKLPENAKAVHFGIFLARPINALRMCVTGLSAEKIPIYLSSMGVQGLAETTPLAEYSQQAELKYINLNILEGFVHAYLGVELHKPNTRLEGLDEAWNSFLQCFIDQKLAHEQDKKYLSDWCRIHDNIEQINTITHVKYVSQKGKPPQAKVYIKSLLTSRPSLEEKQFPHLELNEPLVCPSVLQQRLLHQAFFEQALLAPNAMAIESQYVYLTYGEVAKLVRHVASKLLLPGDGLVAILLPPGWEQAIAVLATLLKGGVYLPIEESWPTQRIAEVLECSGAKTLITTTELQGEKNLAEFCTKENITNVMLEENLDFTLAQQEPFTELPVFIQRDDHLAYIIYTSGSTGKPKGVMITHLSALNTIDDINQQLQVTKKDKFIAYSAMTFDLSVYDLFGSLSIGGTLVYLETNIRIDFKKIAQFVKQRQITVWNTVPAAMALLVDYLETVGESVDFAIRTVLLSGDWVPVNLANRIWQLFGNHVSVTSLGGATEGAIWSILHPITPEVTRGSSIPYGAYNSMRAQRILVLDEQQNICSVGEKGELYIVGEGVAMGYWRDPVLTQARFMELPKLGRAFKTGDEGSMNAEGVITFHGRLDFQAKVQSYRVDLSEIESKILRIGREIYPQLQQAIAVAAKPESSHETDLFVYLVCSADVSPNLLSDFISELTKRLSAILLPYMIPNASNWMCIHTLPLSANQKVDRSLLAQSEFINKHRISVVFPSQEKQTLCTIDTLRLLWQDILNTDASVSDGLSFLEQGGDSIKIRMLLHKIKQHYGVNLRIGDVYSHSYLANMVTLIQEKQHEKTGNQSIHLVGGIQIDAVIKVQDGERGTFILFPPASGLSFPYLRFSNLADYAIYAMNSPSFRAGGEKFSSIEAMAASYFDEVKKLIKKGSPCFFGGWSLGGILALELARRFQQEGWEIDGVIMLDSFYPNRIKATSEDYTQAVEMMVEAEPGLPKEFIPIIKEQYIAAETLLLTYDPAPYVGKVFLFKLEQKIAALEADLSLFSTELAESLKALYMTDDYQWSSTKTLQNLSIIKIVGKHFRLFDAGSSALLELSRELSAIVEKVTQEIPGSLTKDKIEMQLLAFCVEALEKPAEFIKLTDSLFSLGNHVFCKKLTHYVQEKFEIETNTTTLLACSTISELAIMIENNSSKELRSFSSLMLPIQTEGAQPPFFMIHPGGGFALPYKKLQHCLPRAFYGINEPYIFADRSFRSLQEMVDCYTCFIQEIQPKGPYYLGGWSFGGLAALAIAQKLQSNGHSVSQIIMIDTIVRANAPLPQNYTQWLDNEVDKQIRYLKSEEISNLRPFMIKEIQQSDYFAREFSYSFYDGQVILLKAADIQHEAAADNAVEHLEYQAWLQEKMRDSDNGWSPYLSNLQTHLVPGKHEDLFSSPFVEEVGNVLRSVLNQECPNATTNMAMLQTQDVMIDRRLTLAQQRLWFENQKVPFNVSNAYCHCQINGVMDLKKLQRSFEKTIRHHEIFRTYFTEKAGVSKRNVVPMTEIPWMLFDCSSLLPESAHIKRNYILETEIKTVFLTSELPLAKAILIKTESNSYCFSFIYHSMLLDTYSANLVMQEIFYRYVHIDDWEVAPEVFLKNYLDHERTIQLSSSYSMAKKYWKNKLNNYLPYVDFVPFSSENKKNSSHENKIHFNFSTGLSAQLKNFSQELNVTLFDFLISAFSVLLCRWTQQQNMLIGYNHPRSDDDYKNLVAYLENLLILPVQIEPDENFISFVKSIAILRDNASAYSFYPYQELIRLLREEHEDIINLINVKFFEHPYASYKLPGVDVTKHEMLAAEITNDLVMAYDASSDTISFTCKYHAKIFSEESIRRFIKHYENLCRTLLEKVETSIAALPLLSTAEFHQQLVEWNQTQHSFSQTTIHQLFEAQVEKTPNAVALVYENETITYRELNVRANQVAHYLRLNGVGGQPNMLVGLGTERSIEMIVGRLAISKIGAACVPMDPAYPDNHLAYMLSDAKIIFVLIQQHSIARWSDLSTNEQVYTLIALDATDLFVTCSRHNINSSIRLNDLAYVRYTSDTTGAPQGVMIAHHSLMNLVMAINQTLNMQAHDRFLALTSMSVDIAELEWYAPLIVGASIILANQQQVNDIDALITYIQITRPSVMQATPSRWSMLLEVGWQIDTSLKILVGGEALHQPLATKLLRQSVEVWNIYGSTETTICSSCARVQKDLPIHIGEPLMNTQFYVLSDALTLLPVGAVGQLYIGGSGLAQGYWNNGVLTEKRFIFNPFIAGEKIYKTGDLVRHLSSGNLEYVGQTDNQIKIRGFRLELGEIEAQLLKQADISNAVVLAQESCGNKQLVAYVVSHNTVDIPILKKQLSVFLPEYMIPSYVMQLEKIALNMHGKVDKKALSTLGLTMLANQYTASIIETQKKLTILWAELLNIPVESIGINDSFFKLGGHSFLVLQLLSRMKREFKINISVAYFFYCPTIAETIAKNDVCSNNNKWSKENLVKTTRMTKDILSATSETATVDVQMATEEKIKTPLACRGFYACAHHTDSATIIAKKSTLT